MSTNEKLPALLKELRKEVHNIKLKPLMRLDRSDRLLLENKLRQLISELIRIQATGEAQCSIVLEMFEHMGGELRKGSN